MAAHPSTASATARGIGDVAFDQLAPEALEVRRTAPASDKTSDGTTVVPQSPNDPMPDEPGRPSDEDH